MADKRLLQLYVLICAVNLHLMLRRIPHDPPVSEDCKDLIRRIFTPNPLHRITVQEILQHPWFLIDLPEELRMADWNGQVLQIGTHIPSDFAQRAKDIRETVRAALQAHVIGPQPPPKWPQHHASGSFGGLSDISDEGANF